LSPSAFLRSNIQNVGDGIVVTDANDRVALVSRAAESVFNALPDGLLRTDLKTLLGADPGSVGGDRTNGGLHDVGYRMDGSAVEVEVEVEVEYRIVREDGEVRHVRVRGQPVFDSREKL